MYSKFEWGVAIRLTGFVINTCTWLKNYCVWPPAENTNTCLIFWTGQQLKRVQGEGNWQRSAFQSQRTQSCVLKPTKSNARAVFVLCYLHTDGVPLHLTFFWGGSLLECVCLLFCYDPVCSGYHSSWVRRHKSSCWSEQCVYMHQYIWGCGICSCMMWTEAGFPVPVWQNYLKFHG